MEKIIKKGILIGIVIGSFFGTVEAFAVTTITGLGTDTLTVTSDFSEYDRVLNYVASYDENSFGPVNPINTSPTNVWQGDYTSTNETEPAKFIETNTACGAMSLNYAGCLATGQAVGNGYYVVDGLWYEVGDPPPVYGCTDSEANNYDPEATIDDGSCEYDTPIDPDISEASEKEIVYTLYILLISVSTGLVCGIFALLFYASLAILRERK